MDTIPTDTSDVAAMAMKAIEAIAFIVRDGPEWPHITNRRGALWLIKHSLFHLGPRESAVWWMAVSYRHGIMSGHGPAEYSNQTKERIRLMLNEEIINA